MSETDWDTCDQHAFTFPRHTECPYCRIAELEAEVKRLDLAWAGADERANLAESALHKIHDTLIEQMER